jgi:uncharacterized protein with GYD domain
MGTYIVLTRVSPEAVKTPGRREELCHEVEAHIKERQLPIRWIANYAVTGRFDYLDIFEAPDDAAAMNLSAILRSYGHATTETWSAIPWEQFVKAIRDL